MKKFILLSLTISFCLFNLPKAQAETWGFLAGMNRWQLTGAYKTANPKFAPQFGVAMFNQGMPLELDILYTNKETVSGGKETSFQFPFFYRANITKEFRFGLGGFFDYNTSDHAYGRQKLDMGLATSLQYMIPFGKSLLSFEGRYLYGTADLPGKSMDIAFLVGLIFK
jgi:hypothetical protein